MKKSLVLVIIILVAISAFFAIKYKEHEINQIDLNNFNLLYQILISYHQEIKFFVMDQRFQYMT